MQWQPTMNIAFGYAQTNLRWWDIEDKLAGKLQKAVTDCYVARPLRASGDGKFTGEKVGRTQSRAGPDRY